SDTLFNSSTGGKLYGDRESGQGPKDADTFWWSAGSFIMDAGQNDRLKYAGIQLIGGTNGFFWGAALESGVAREWYLPWITYGLTKPDEHVNSQLIVSSNWTGPKHDDSS